MQLPALIEAVLRLLEALFGHAAEARGRGQGRLEALTEGLKRATASIETARQAEAEAETAHRKDPTDAAFDPEFRRND